MANKLPRESIGDYAHLAARMALSAIPGVGGPAVELFNQLLAPPIQRRREAWCNDLVERLAKLEFEGRFNLKDLCNNEEFISTFLQASMVAIRFHQREKKEALRNAVLNAAVGESLDDSMQELFLTFVESLTPWHLRVLREIYNRHEQTKQDSKIETTIDGISEFAQKLFPDLRRQPALADIVAEDLCRRGLLFWNRGVGVTYITRGTTQVTELGREFLRFISDP